MSTHPLNEQLPTDLESDRKPAPQIVSAFSDEVAEQEVDRLPLSHYLWSLRRHYKKIIAFAIVCELVTYLVSSRMQPLYQSTATVNVDRQEPADVVGQDSTQANAPRDVEEFLTTQVKLIQSDEVLRPVAEQFHFLGNTGQAGPSSPSREIQSDEPVTLPGLKVLRPPNTYLIQITYQSPNPHLAADVANAIAKSYVLYTYNLRTDSAAGLSSFMEKQLDELKSKMERSGLAVAQFENGLNVVNPEERTDILSARLQQLNTEYTTAQADRIRAQAIWEASRSGSLGAVEASSQSDDLAKLADALDQARQHFALVDATYGENHPEYFKAASELSEVQKEFDEARSDLMDRIQAQYNESLSREQMLQTAVATTKAEWDGINARSFEFQRLKQEADTDKGLYDELIKKIREADINAGFRNNNIRIANIARPAGRPVFPNTRTNLIRGLFLSMLIGIIGAIVIDSLDTTIRDPREASRFLGTDVIATMPTDLLAAHLPRPPERLSETDVTPVTGKRESHNGYYPSGSSFDEAIRTLRNTIFLSDFENRLHSIAITSAAPAEGKSTLAAHLAIANADRGMKTLLVDGDLRRPSLHARFGLTPHRGLSNALTGDLPWRDVVIPIDGKPNLSLLPSGRGSHRAADLIGPRLSGLLDEFANEFDLVILDTPPLLGFAESLQIAAAADGVLIVSKAAETKRRAVVEVITTLRRLRANVLGVILNQVSRTTSADGYYPYYGYYGKKYLKHYAHSTPEGR